MKFRHAFFSQFNNVPYFTKNNLLLAAKKFNLKTDTLNSYIARGLAEKTLISIKKGTYITNTYFELHKKDIAFTFFIANILITPSYITSESALSYYGLMAESTSQVITSVTTKLPRNISNKLGFFSYRSISNNNFNGYVNIVENNCSFLIAEKFKAIYDYLYYRVPTKSLTEDNLEILTEDYRIDLDSLSRKEINSLKVLLK